VCVVAALGIAIELYNCRVAGRQSGWSFLSIVVAEMAEMGAAEAGNYKGVMLCNRPTEPSSAPPPLNPTVDAPSFRPVGLPAEPLGLNPAKENLVSNVLAVHDEASRRRAADGRPQQTNFLNKHRAWLAEMGRKKAELNAELQSSALAAEQKRAKFVAYTKSLRQAVRARAAELDDLGVPHAELQLHKSIPPPPQYDYGAPSEPYSAPPPPPPAPAAYKAPSKASASKPAWAMTEDEADDFEDAEAALLVDFAKDLDCARTPLTRTPLASMRARRAGARQQQQQPCRRAGSSTTPRRRAAHEALRPFLRRGSRAASAAELPCRLVLTALLLLARLSDDSYIDDLEVRQALNVIRERIDTKKAMDAVAADVDEADDKIAAAGGDWRAQFVSEWNGDDAKSTASRRAPIPRDEFGEGGATKQPEWDVSTAAGDARETRVSGAAREMAEQLLNDNPDMRAKHSVKSLASIVEKVRPRTRSRGSSLGARAWRCAWRARASACQALALPRSARTRRLSRHRARRPLRDTAALVAAARLRVLRAP
jgi:hypothetical protein